MKLYILLPAFNEELSIDSLFSGFEEHLAGYDYEVLLVNDGSSDGTEKKAMDWKGRIKVRIIGHERNRGLWETIRDGFEAAAKMASPDDIIVRMDCDITHDPKYIPSMIDKINEGFDVVLTSRFQPGGGMTGLDSYRSFISITANRLLKLLFPMKNVYEFSCGYRAYRASIIQEALKRYGNDFISVKGVGFTCTVEKLLRMREMGARIAEVPFVLHYDRKLSQSKMLSGITTLGYCVLMAKYTFFRRMADKTKSGGRAR